MGLLRLLPPFVAAYKLKYTSSSNGKKGEVELASTSQVGYGRPEHRTVVKDHGQTLRVHLVSVVVDSVYKRTDAVNKPSEVLTIIFVYVRNERIYITGSDVRNV